MKKIAIIISVFSIISCQQVITLPLDKEPSKISIEGIINNSQGPYFVYINKSISFYDDNSFPSVSNASVSITDSTLGVTDILSETSQGIYTTHNIIGKTGHTYLLKVQVDGNTYTSSSKMPNAVPLDSVSFDNKTKNTIRAVAHFKDPVGVGNFYKYTTTVNGVEIKRFQAFSDRLSDGRYINDKIDNDSTDIKNGDNVKLNLISINEKVYTFLNEAEKIAYKNANLAAPATPTSNISGGCLGYFSAQAVSSKTAKVKY